MIKPRPPRNALNRGMPKKTAPMNLQTQAKLDAEYTQAYDSDPDIWGVVDDDEDFCRFVKHVGQ